ncbi:hypothetical protein [Thalassotalea agariperforans]
MPLKVLIKIYVISLILLVSGCSSTSSHVACDFVGAVAKNAGERHRDKDKVDIYGNPVKKHQNSDIVTGILSIFVGATSRAIDDEEKEACT